MRFRSTRLLLALACLVASSQAGLAQVVHVRPVAEQGTSATLEVSAEWGRTLQQVVDSTGSTQITAGFVSAASSGMLLATEKLDLPAYALPQVRVVGSEYDEISLPLAAEADTLVALLGGPLVEAVGLGWERKQPAATLVVRLVMYDPETSTLRRYRRVQVQVEHGRAVQMADPFTGRRSDFRASDNPHLDVSRSVLADGYVFKIPVAEEGIYRIDRTYLDNLLEEVGQSVEAIQADRIKLYGNGGEPLPAPNSAPRPADLVEAPVSVRTDAQGFVDLTFYGRGTSGWRFDNEGQTWVHYIHPSATQNYYFLKVAPEGPPGTRTSGGVFPSYPDAQRRATVTGRALKDFDDVMWSQEGRSGLTWVSRQIRSYESLDVLSGVAFPGFTSGVVQYVARAAIRSNPGSSVYFTSNGAELARLSAPRVGVDNVDPVAAPTQGTFSHSVQAGQVPSLTMQVAPLASGAIEPQAAMDWIRVFYPKLLQAENGYLRFATPPGEEGRFAFVLTGFSQPPTVWDVTDHNAVRPLGVQAEGDGYIVQLEVGDAAPREIVAFTAAAARPVQPAVLVPAQNLHGIQTYPDFVIVAPDTFRRAADELAVHRSGEGLAVEVVDVADIYNEFSGGLPDMRAVRDYLKFLYDRAPDESSLLRYVLLFGDGHYNYRGLEREPQLANWILPFESEETFNPLESYTSDDYFGLLDDNEGAWPYIGHTAESAERVDIGIGRLPIQTAADAQAIVGKIKSYESVETYGAWRTQYAFVADDHLTGTSGTQDERDLHTQNADVVAEVVRDLYPAVNLQKIYAISYDRVFSGIWRIPAAREDVLSAINKGILLFNYAGHGGIDGLAQEQIFTKEDAAALENLDRLPIFVTATCSFGRWDMDDTQSAAEVLLNNPRGGAVGLFTTVRTVFTNHIPTTLNLGLNRQLNVELFKREENGLPRRLGDVLRETKNTLVGLEGNNRKFNLLGDPTMRLGIPTPRAVVTEVDGAPVSEQQAQLPALEHVTISGQVLAPGGQVDEQFNGTVNLTVYDAERRVPVEQQYRLANPYYVVREDLIWRGDVTVAGGRYQAEFVVPKDISYSNQTGRIAVYATGGGAQVSGFSENIVVGGSSGNPPNDAEGPQVSLFLNDTTFVSGGLTASRPELIIKLFDASGINTVGTGVGHEMMLTVDGNSTRSVNLNTFYSSEDNSYQKGSVRYELSDYVRRSGEEGLPPGPHELEVKVWDVLNNSTDATLDFYVTAGEDLAIRNVFNYPNPMVSGTQFVFEHNQLPGTPADVQIRIYTLAGRPVKTIERNEVLPGGVLQIPWDGRDEDWDRLATGVYLYKLRVKVDTEDGGTQVAERVEKLAIIR